VTFHFIGIAGTGMRPLALLALARGQQITGSDRLFDQGGASAIRGQLEAAGARIVPQDGAGVVRGLEAVVVSSAIELQVPDYLRAKELASPSSTAPSFWRASALICEPWQWPAPAANRRSQR